MSDFGQTVGGGVSGFGQDAFVRVSGYGQLAAIEKFFTFLTWLLVMTCDELPRRRRGVARRLLSVVRWSFVRTLTTRKRALKSLLGVSL